MPPSFTSFKWTTKHLRPPGKAASWLFNRSKCGANFWDAIFASVLLWLLFASLVTCNFQMFWQLRRDDILASNSFRFTQSRAEIAIFFYEKIFQKCFQAIKGAEAYYSYILCKNLSKKSPGNWGGRTRRPYWSSSCEKGKRCPKVEKYFDNQFSTYYHTLINYLT